MDILSSEFAVHTPVSHSNPTGDFPLGLSGEFQHISHLLFSALSLLSRYQTNCGQASSPLGDSDRISEMGAKPFLMLSNWVRNYRKSLRNYMDHRDCTSCLNIQ